MTNMQQNKKRKHDDGESSPQHHSASSGNEHQIIKQNDEHNFEADLNEEVIRANSLLISIGSKIKLVDNLYFAKNGAMIDEFIENMDQLIQQLESHRKKTCNDLLNSDILMNVYEFLNTDTLKNCCGLVSKLWRESLRGLKVKPHHNNFWNSSLVNHVCELKLTWASKVKLFEPFSNCTSLNRLKILDLSEIYYLDTPLVELLMKCNTPCLTELKMDRVTINETDMIQLLTSNLMSTVKKLNLSSTIKDFTNTFYESVSESKNLQQITHLEIGNLSPQIEKRIDFLLKDKFNLEYLQLSKYQSKYFTNLLTNGYYTNLTCLDIY